MSIGNSHIPHANTRFSLIHNDVASPILAVGSAVEIPSFIHKQRLRSDHQATNIEAAFYAAMNMLDKRVEFRYIPHNYLLVNDVPIHFVGETNHKHSEIILDGDINKGKFVMYYVYGEEIIGFCTVGYKNLHLYLWEAMKLLIMPPAMQLRGGRADHKAIVASVLKVRDEIRAKRRDTVKLPSIIRAEFTREREKLGEFRGKLKQNMAMENEKQKQRFKKMKANYDKEGVDVIENEGQIGQDDRVSTNIRNLGGIKERVQAAEHDAADAQRRDGSQLTRTKRGGYKPGGSYGQTDHDLMNYENRNTNMGVKGPDQTPKTPFSQVIDFAKSDWDQKNGRR